MALLWIWVAYGYLLTFAPAVCRSVIMKYLNEHSPRYYNTDPGRSYFFSGMEPGKIVSGVDRGVHPL